MLMYKYGFYIVCVCVCVHAFSFVIIYLSQHFIVFDNGEYCVFVIAHFSVYR